MEFPISVIVIEDEIVLLQGQITEEFRKKLNNVDYERLGVESIKSKSAPQITYCIYINGDTITRNYKYESIPYIESRYNRYIASIKAYKKEMGYV